MTSSEAGPRRSSKALPKAKLAPKKVMVTVWWSAASLIHYFWIPTKPLRLRSMLSKSRCTKNCSTCSGQQEGPSSSPQQCLTNVARPTLEKLNELGLIRHIHLTSHQLTTTSLSISTTSCMENLSTSRRRQKIFSKSLSNPEAWIFMLPE